jgi:hypothetical protein
MDPLSIITGMFGNDGIGSIIKEAITKDMIEQIIEKTSAKDIEILLLAALAFKANDTGITEKVIETIGKISLYNTLPSNDNGGCD